MSSAERYPAGTAWFQLTKAFRSRLKRKRDGEQLIAMLERLEVTAMAAGCEMTREYYEKQGAGAQPRG